MQYTLRRVLKRWAQHNAARVVNVFIGLYFTGNIQHKSESGEQAHNTGRFETETTLQKRSTETVHDASSRNTWPGDAPWAANSFQGTSRERGRAACLLICIRRTILDQIYCDSESYKRGRWCRLLFNCHITYVWREPALHVFRSMCENAYVCTSFLLSFTPRVLLASPAHQAFHCCPKFLSRSQNGVICASHLIFLVSRHRLFSKAPTGPQQEACGKIDVTFLHILT